MEEKVSAERILPQEMKFLHYLRDIALILILYDHLLPGAYYAAGTQPPIGVIEEYILWPLAIINHFGAFGVDIFFLISGFVICHSAKNAPKVTTFLLKRFFRIIPPILFGWLVYTVFSAICGFAALRIGVQYPSASYFSANGALWTMKVEILFYVLFAVCLPLYKRRPLAGTLLLLMLNIGICQFGTVNQNLFALAQTCSYIFYAIAGMVIYLVWSGRAGKLQTVLFAAAVWYCIVRYNIQVFNPERYAPDNSFGVSAIYAVLFFLVFLLAEDRFAERPWVKTISRYSYGLYLHHMPFLALLIPLLGTQIPILAVVTGVLSWAATYLQLHFVEQPCAKLLKKCMTWRIKI